MEQPPIAASNGRSRNGNDNLQHLLDDMKKTREENGNCLSTSNKNNPEGNDIRKDDNYWRVPGFRRTVEYKDHVEHLISPVSRLGIDSPTTPRIKASLKKNSTSARSPTTETPRTSTRRRGSMSGLISMISPPITQQDRAASFADWQGHSPNLLAPNNEHAPSNMPLPKIHSATSSVASKEKQPGFVRRNTRRRNEMPPGPTNPRKARSNFSPQMLASLDGGGPPRKSRSTFSAELLSALDAGEGSPVHAMPERQQGEDRHLGLGFEFSRLSSDRCLGSNSGKDKEAIGPKSSTGISKERREKLSRNSSESNLCKNTQKVKEFGRKNSLRAKNKERRPNFSRHSSERNLDESSRKVKEFGRKNSLPVSNKERRPKLSRHSSERGLDESSGKDKEFSRKNSFRVSNKERRPNLSSIHSERSLDTSSRKIKESGSKSSTRRVDLARMSSDRSLHQRHRKSKGPSQKIQTSRNESTSRQQPVW
jgi:hypothetical protein